MQAGSNENNSGPRWRLYVFVVVLTGVTLVLRLGLRPWDEGQPLLILFLFPIAISAYLGGLLPGLLATGLMAVAADYFLIPPIHAFGFASPVAFAHWLFMLLVGVLLSVLFEELSRLRPIAPPRRSKAATSPPSARSASGSPSRWPRWARSAWCRTCR